MRQDRNRVAVYGPDAHKVMAALLHATEAMLKRNWAHRVWVGNLMIRHDTLRADIATLRALRKADWAITR
jgi:hypothetical protein